MRCTLVLVLVLGCEGQRSPNRGTSSSSPVAVGSNPWAEQTAGDPQGGPANPPSITDAGAGGSRFNPFRPRRENTTCRLPREPLPSAVATEEVYPNLDFDRPLWFGFAPDGSGRRYVAEQGGNIWVFDGSQTRPEKELFLALEVRRRNNEEGLLGLAFHPRYSENGRLFVSYSASDPQRNVVSEFRRSANDSKRADPQSERVILELEQPFGNHNGGDIRFGPDGFLYVSFGDGGAAGDPMNHGARPSTWLGSMLRIDVDGAQPYTVPPDNPFVDGRTVPGDNAPARPEVWAYGLRNVWRFSFDGPTGALWAGDVGQDQWEEVGVLEAGAHHGWKVLEGFACYRNPACTDEGFKGPVFAYPHSEGRSVTGGHVYRGADLPELVGAYVFGDFESGRMWALRARDSALDRVVDLGRFGHNVASFGVDPEGELYVVDFRSGKSLHRLVRAPAAEVPPAFPRRLSETGCFEDLQSLRPAAGVLPYEVNHPFWSDGSTKRRFVALPAGETMSAHPQGWIFPEGTVLIKHFERGGEKLETRLWARRARGWQGYTYRWSGSDAQLLEGRVRGDGSSGPWEYPSRADCSGCHKEIAGYALGWRWEQLDRVVGEGAAAYDQLDAWRDAGLLVGDKLDISPLPGPGTGDIEEQARAWLDANCANCHRPNGSAGLDLRDSTPLRDMGVCDEDAQHGALGMPGGKLLVPGNPSASVLVARLSRRGPQQMPPFGSIRVDEDGAAVVSRWIQALRGCAPPTE